MDLHNFKIYLVLHAVQNENFDHDINILLRSGIYSEIIYMFHFNTSCHFIIVYYIPLWYAHIEMYTIAICTQTKDKHI